MRKPGTLSVGHQHEFGSLTFFRLTHLKPPFFASEKVPSPIACDQSSNFRRSSRFRNRSQALTINPAPSNPRVAASRLKERDIGLVNLAIEHPSSGPKGFLPGIGTRRFWGRPPSGEGSGFSNRSLMRFHWESLINGFGAVLDPVVFGRRRFGHMDRVISM